MTTGCAAAGRRSRWGDEVGRSATRLRTVPPPRGPHGARGHVRRADVHGRVTVRAGLATRWHPGPMSHIDRRERRPIDWDRVRGIFAIAATIFIVGSWLVNPATLPW